MKRTFEDNASPLTVVNIKTHKHLLDDAQKLFASKYPEFAKGEGDDFHEDFSAQLGRKGFFLALVDSSTNEVKGLTAGLTYSSNTASLTYIVTPDDEAASQKLKDETLQTLKKRGVQAVYAELYKQGQEENPERDTKERAIYQRLGAEKAPISYRQPLYGDDDTEITGLELHALFTGSDASAAQKSQTTAQHLQAFTEYYDPNIDNPKNAESLKTYKKELAQARWNVAPSGPVKTL